LAVERHEADNKLNNRLALSSAGLNASPVFIPSLGMQDQGTLDSYFLGKRPYHGGE
jgi:hypothetical protein